MVLIRLLGLSSGRIGLRGSGLRLDAKVVSRQVRGGFELVYEVWASLWGGFDPLGVVLTGLRRFGTTLGWF